MMESYTAKNGDYYYYTDETENLWANVNYRVRRIAADGVNTIIKPCNCPEDCEELISEIAKRDIESYEDADLGGIAVWFYTRKPETYRFTKNGIVFTAGEEEVCVTPAQMKSMFKLNEDYTYSLSTGWENHAIEVFKQYKMASKLFRFLDNKKGHSLG